MQASNPHVFSPLIPQFHLCSHSCFCQVYILKGKSLILVSHRHQSLWVEDWLVQGTHPRRGSFCGGPWAGCRPCSPARGWTWQQRDAAVRTDTWHFCSRRMNSQFTLFAPVNGINGLFFHWSLKLFFSQCDCHECIIGAWNFKLNNWVSTSKLSYILTIFPLKI